jgi:hypothetical protein
MTHARIAAASIAVAALLLACKPAGPPPPPPLTPLEQEAKDRGECHVLAVNQSRFDPTLAAEPPPRTISETHKQGGDVVGSGAIAKGAVVGGLVGVAGGAIAGNAGAGAAIGAGAGGLIGGVRRHKETQKMVTTTRTNPEYTAYVEAKNGYRSAFDACMTSRAAAAAAAKPAAP